MQSKPPMSAGDAELRRQAEARLGEQPPDPDLSRTEADTQRLVHELQVHQIELELQKEELEQSRNAVEAGFEKYSDLYDFAPVSYLTLDREGAIREANHTSASLLGIERSRLLKRRLGSFVSAVEIPGFNAFLARVFESGARTSCEVTLQRDGQPPVAARIEAVAVASGQECRAVIEDLTEHKRAEEDRLLVSKVESTGMLVGGLADDYQNLLTVILLNLELAQTLVPPSEEFLSRRLQTAERAAFLAQDLTRQLVSVVQGDPPVRTAASLAPIIHGSVKWALSGAPVRCDFSLPEDLWAADIDERPIGQALRNLVLNAKEAMRRGGVISVSGENVVVHPRERPSLPPGAYIRITISDQGCGVAPEILPRIFDPYFTTKQRGDRKGLGLGLTICQAIVQKHGGTIAVESEVEKGATFRFYLPACRNGGENGGGSGSSAPA